MKNIAEKAVTVLGIGIATMANADAKAMEAYRKLDFDINKELTVLKAETAATNTYDATADFQNPAKNTKSREKLETETEPTPAEKAQAKELVKTLFELADYEAMGEYLAKNGDNLSKVVLNEALKVVKDKISVAGDNANFARKEVGHYKSVVKSNPAYQKTLEASIKFEKEYMAEVSHFSSVRSSIKDLLNKFNLPDNADKIGIKNMDPVFAGILENPKFEGTIKNNKELNDLVFAGFSPEFQKRFNELGLKVLVKKYPTKVKIYFVCGTREDGKEYKVQIGDTRWKNQNFYILKDKKYNEILSMDDIGESGGFYTQQIREISPTELEKRVIDKEGSIIPSGTIIITKNSNIHGNKIANN